MRKAFFQLEDAKQYEKAQWWDLAFLQKYLDLSITPRGLCIKKQCSFLDEDLMKEWRLVSELCTLKWIKILVQQRERKLKSAQQQVLEKEKNGPDLHVFLSVFQMGTGPREQCQER